MTRSRNGLGVLFMIVSGLCVAIQGYLVKQSLPLFGVETLLLGRFAVGFVLLSLYLVFLHRTSTLVHQYVKTRAWTLSICAALCGGASIGCYFSSLEKLSLSIATLLFLSVPLFLPWVYNILVGQKVSYGIIGGTILMCIGIACLFILGPLWAHSLALLSGVFMALWIVLIQKLHAQESSLNIALHYFGIAALCAFGVFLVSRGVTFTGLTSLKSYYLAGLGLIALMCQLFLTLSLRYASARLVTPFIYSTLVFTLMVDDQWLQASFGAQQMVGMVMMVLGAIWILKTTWKRTRGNL